MVIFRNPSRAIALGVVFALLFDSGSAAIHRSVDRVRGPSGVDWTLQAFTLPSKEVTRPILALNNVTARQQNSHVVQIDLHHRAQTTIRLKAHHVLALVGLGGLFRSGPTRIQRLSLELAIHNRETRLAGVTPDKHSSEREAALRSSKSETPVGWFKRLRSSPGLQHIAFVILYGSFYLLQRHAVTHITTIQFLTGLFLWTTIFSGLILAVDLASKGGVRSEGRALWQGVRAHPRWLVASAFWGIILQYVNVLIFSIPFAHGWGSPTEFTAIDALGTTFVGVWLWVLYRERVKSNVWWSGVLVALAGLLFAIVRPASDIPSGVSPFYRVVGFTMFTIVAALLARSILAKVRLNGVIEQAARGPEPERARSLVRHYAPLISFLEAAMSLAAVAVTGPWISGPWLNQPEPAWAWHAPTVGAAWVSAVAWWGMSLAISRGLKTSQFIPSFNSMPAWVLLWSAIFDRAALPAPALLPLALTACLLTIGGAYIGNQSDMPSALRPLRALPTQFRWGALAFTVVAFIFGWQALSPAPVRSHRIEQRPAAPESPLLAAVRELNKLESLHGQRLEQPDTQEWSRRMARVKLLTDSPEGQTSLELLIKSQDFQNLRPWVQQFLRTLLKSPPVAELLNRPAFFLQVAA